MSKKSWQDVIKERNLSATLRAGQAELKARRAQHRAMQAKIAQVRSKKARLDYLMSLPSLTRDELNEAHHLMADIEALTSE